MSITYKELRTRFAYRIFPLGELPRVHGCLYIYGRRFPNYEEIKKWVTPDKVWMTYILGTSEFCSARHMDTKDIGADPDAWWRCLHEPQPLARNPKPAPMFDFLDLGVRKYAWPKRGLKVVALDSTWEGCYVFVNHVSITYGEVRT